MEPSNTWNRVEQIFEQALERPAAEREAWVRDQCATDPAVRDEVLVMLNAQDRVGEFLQAPLLDFCGQSFGPYTAVEEIGRGGMSVVYRGQRSDGDFEKQVAIKVILLQTVADVGKGETQILAGLEHPNIARLLDAGTTALGFRYLLMEYVEGKPLTTYCADTGERQKLELFLAVCEAVQFAHRALVVHRDLKPDNIFVTREGRVKLLDFGIAKILDPLANKDQTQGVHAFSPNYASPEQLLGQPVTTSTDVYSLGVVLCELLGGRPPRLLAGLSLEQMVDEARAAVKELPLRGDLAAIAGKALRTDTGERYESAGALARDVERYLRGMPIEAREPTWSYRAARFVVRHRYSVGAASLATLGLVAALGIAIWQAGKAEKRFDEVRELARAMMFEVHDEIQFLPGSLGARKVIVDRSVHYLDALAADPSASAGVRLDLAQGYLRLSEIEGKDLGGASLGRSEEALKHALRAVEIARPLAKGAGASLPATVALTDALSYASSAYVTRGETDRAVALGEEALPHAENLVRANPADPEQKERLAAVTKQVADAYSRSATREKAIPLFERALVIREELLREEPDDDMRQRRFAESHQWLANEYWGQKDYEKCEKHAREAMRMHESRYAARPRSARVNLASSALMLAMSSLQAKRHEEAVQLLERALTLRRETVAEDPKSAVAALRVAAVLNRIGLAYREWGRPREAAQYGERALVEARKVWELDRKNMHALGEMVFAQSDLALTYEKAGRKGRACGLARESIKMAQNIPDRHPAKGVIKKMEAITEGCE
ncbi:MAG: serine/threonine protein kinase [Bryobacterales bacterium]|nr:serine/threonine protein kinase [Bryobacterales bacterium]